VTEI